MHALQKRSSHDRRAATVLTWAHPFLPFWLYKSVCLHCNALAVSQPQHGARTRETHYNIEKQQHGRGWGWSSRWWQCAR